MPFAEESADREATDVVRVRVDGTYALGQKLDDPCSHFSTLPEFRGRLGPGGYDTPARLRDSVSGGQLTITCALSIGSTGAAPKRARGPT